MPADNSSNNNMQPDCTGLYDHLVKNFSVNVFHLACLAFERFHNFKPSLWSIKMSCGLLEITCASMSEKLRQVSHRTARVTISYPAFLPYMVWRWGGGGYLSH